MREMACEGAVGRQGTDSPKVQAKEEGSAEKRKRTGGWKGEDIPRGNRHYKIQGMEHILWWLRLISIHIEHFASESRRVQRCMSVAGAAAWSDCGAGAVWLLHTAAKSMGGRGAVYQIASMSSVRSVHSFTSSEVKYTEITPVWHSGSGEILSKKNQGLLRTWNQGKFKENPTWWNVTIKMSQVLVAGIWKMRKRMITIKHLEPVDVALRYSLNMKQANLQMKSYKRFGILNIWKLSSFRVFLPHWLATAFSAFYNKNALMRRFMLASAHIRYHTVGAVLISIELLWW